MSGERRAAQVHSGPNWKRCWGSASLPTIFLCAGLWMVVSPDGVLGGEERERSGELPPLVGDRPDTAESSETVPIHHLQIEAGIFYERDEEGNIESDSLTVPQLLLRYGLFEDLELRFGTDGYIREEVEIAGMESDQSGASDLEVGFKYHFLDEERLQPSTAVLASVNLPTGDNAFSSDEAELNVILAADKSFQGDFSVAVNIGASSANDPAADDRFVLFSYAIALGFGLTERVSAFVETFGEIPADGPSGPLHSADAGVVILLTEATAVDIAGKVGISSEAADWGVGLGLVHRF